MKPFKPPSPIATNTLIGLCFAVQAALVVGGPGFANAIRYAFGLIPARISAALAGTDPMSTGAGAAAAAATILTHIFIHSGWLHLGLNLLFLAWVGRYVEWVTGRWALIGVFVGGGIAGGTLQVLVDPASPLPIIGASGAIAAVFGAYAVLFARSRAEPRSVAGVLISGETLTAVWYAATWIGLQLLTAAVVNTGVVNDGGPRIAIWTHIGGFLTGLLVAQAWGKGPKPD